MQRYHKITVILLLFHSLLGAQKSIALRTQLLFQGKQPQSYALFNPSMEAKGDVLSYVESARTMIIRPDILQSILNTEEGLIRIELPAPQDIQLDLYRTDIFSSSAMIRTSDGRVILPNPNHRFYRGMIHGNANSLAIVSVFEDRIQILYADASGNHRIQKTQDGSYIAFRDDDIKIPKQLSCHVDDTAVPDPVSENDPAESRVLTGNCVEVYVECDYESYLDNGSSVANTEEWVAELWNEVITLYDNEDIPVSVSDIYIYTSFFPQFDTLNTTSALLTAFVSHMSGISYDGRLAHLLSTRTLGGGIAYLDVLCSNTHMCAVSASLSTTIVPFPTYSWTVEVVTHEMGHNMGSPHTHACAWNGNNTAIDGCGPAAGYSEGCDGPLPQSGTIMSYCHLVSGVGINFNNGFGPQPGDLIRSEYNNASCNTGTCAPPACTSLTIPAPGSTNADINIDLSWAGSAGALGYKLTVGTTPSNGSILNNVDVGLVTTYNLANSLPFNTTIYVKIVPHNELGEASGCTTQSFSTESDVAPACTQMTQPANGATNVLVDAIIYWAHAVGNQTGYKISIGTTLNGTDIANLVNVGNVTSYDHPVSFPYDTTLYVKITPYWAGGDIAGCASQSFTTWVPVAGDFCTTAIDIACGQSLAGSTLSALPESGLPFCGTSIDAPGVWYKFTGDGQNAVLYTCTQYNYDTKLNVYQGSCGNPVCVTGLDDFCAQGTQVSFPTTNGTSYYVLVQGWNGQQGNFTLTRTCYTGPFYCQASGYYATQEWIKKVVLGSFTKNSVASSYSDFTGDVITLSRGGSYTIEVTPMFSQTPQNEYYKVWGDFNKDGDFNDSGEEIFSAGPTSAVVSGMVTIPLSAQTGTTRMRVMMSRTAITSSCGTFERGEVEDFTFNIRCNLVTSTSDSGNGSLRNVSTCADDGEDILFAPNLNGNTINVTAGPITVDGTWKWMATAGSNIQIKAATTVSRILSVPVSRSAEIQNLKLTGGNASSGSAIDNVGALILRDCDIHPMAGSSSPPLRNRGMLTIFGITDIRP